MQDTVMQPFDWARSLVQKLKLGLGYAMVGSVAVMMASTFVACEFNPESGNSYEGASIDLTDGEWKPKEIELLAETAKLTSPTDDSWWPVSNGGIDPVYDPFMRTYHGYSCAETQDGAWTQNANGNDVIGIRTKHSMAIPTQMEHAMVYLNGWRLSYLGDSDHKIRGFGFFISNARRYPTTKGSFGWRLGWEASGVLADWNGDDPFKACYYFTVLMWNDHGLQTPGNYLEPIQARVMQDGNIPTEDSLTFVHPKGNAGGLRTLSGQWDTDFPKALVPRGYGFMWGSNSDTRLLQVGFELDSQVWLSPGTISWDSAMVFKHNGASDYVGSESVSILAGSGVEMFRLPSILQPRGPSSCPTVPFPTHHTVWTTLTNLTYDYAAPVLSGFNIGDICDDNNVKEMGAYIDAWYYDKDPSEPTGTLHIRLNSIFKDQDGLPGMATPQYKVNVLGFNRGS